MRKTIKRLIAAVVLLSAAASVFSASAYGAGDTLYRNAVALSDDVTYVNEISMAKSGRIESFSLELKPGGDLEQITSSCDTVFGGMTVTNAIAYAEKLGYNVVAAMNTDYFSTNNQIPLGLVIENGVYKSSPEGENALCIMEDGSAVFSEAPQVTMSLAGPGGKTELTHLNKFRTDTSLYLYSSAYSTVSTRAASVGWAVRFKILSGSLAVNSTLELEVDETLADVKAVPIGDGYLVLTAADASGYIEEFEKYAVGDAVTLEISCDDETASNARWATGGGDIIVKDGKITDSSAWDTAISAKNPRSAVGIKADGTTVYLAVDGRRVSYSNGLTLMQLAEELLDRGCVSAMNFDGGGSTAIAMRRPGEGRCTVINSPSDGFVRRCGAYALIVSKAESDGEAARLFLQDDGAVILAGATTKLDISAVDKALRPAEIPGDYDILPTAGTYENGIYKAPETEGTDTVSVVSGDVSGSGTLHVIKMPDTVTVKNDNTGKEVTSLTLKRGESVKLIPRVRHLLRDVIIDESTVIFSAEGEAGTFGDYGIFTAGDKSNVTGKITVRAGESEIKITVKIPAVLEDIEGHWSESYVQTLYDKGIVKGVTATAFMPDGEIRRCDFLLMLY
ncbi:MAG: phosphodiester glycosidase family protein, partial [Oscillospiraceae bacterium]|nr:phosphodiester glycosidase family protein [Oscillospiraceae bacterium]